MTPKEKAEELIENYRNAYPTYTSNRLNLHQTKRCALMAIDEVIEALYEHHWQNRLIIDYWTQVKQEIEKL